MKDPAKYLFDSANSGVYAAPANKAVVRRSAAADGLAWFELDLADVADKAAFLACCATAFSFPSSFGSNWDALADSLEDLSWLPAQGYIVFGRRGSAFARHAPQDFATALEIIDAAATYWRTQHKVFMLLLDVDTRGSRNLKPFPPLLKSGT